MKAIIVATDHKTALLPVCNGALAVESSIAMARHIGAEVINIVVKPNKIVERALKLGTGFAEDCNFVIAPKNWDSSMDAILRGTLAGQRMST